MGKKETSLVRFIGGVFVFMPLYGDISIGVLSAIKNNDNIDLLYNNRHVECKPFGIITLDSMMANAVNPKECSNAINAYYRSSPHDKVFAREHLFIGQSYHFEQIKGGCVLYANGLETYSEMALAQGIALIEPTFDNVEWNTRLQRVQQGAETQKRGLHTTLIRKYCIKEEK